MMGVNPQDTVESTGATGVVDVGGVAVPVSDQERAVRFYVERLGFEIRMDVPMPDGGRWVQVAAPGGRVPIALVVAGGDDPIGVDTRITLCTIDADADHAALARAGVAVGELLRWPGVPPMFSLSDQDGNALKIMERV
jgi:catechol 2,3-dioxygenase-like lactoylglutathione lyase family enzyme